MLQLVQLGSMLEGYLPDCWHICVYTITTLYWARLSLLFARRSKLRIWCWNRILHIFTLACRAKPRQYEYPIKVTFILGKVDLIQDNSPNIVLIYISTLSVKQNLSLLQSVTHWNPKHQHESYLNTDKVNLCLISKSKKTKVYFNQRGDKCDEITRGKFSKITETACLPGWEFEADKSWYWNWIEWIAIECSE